MVGYWSSSGGQSDFARGAMYSPNGQAFIMVPSTTSDGSMAHPKFRDELHKEAAEMGCLG